MLTPAEKQWLPYAESPLLMGDEPVVPGAAVRDFWAWALGDLRLNSTRGLFAQFLVARAVGDTRSRDDGWGDFDVLCPDGIKIEVKAAGYLQSWRQLRPSTISFGGLKARSWSDDTGHSREQEYRADVYVFAVQTCQDPARYDPLDLLAWEFFILPVTTLRALNQKSIALTRLRGLAPPPVPWPRLADAIRAAASAAHPNAGA